MLEKSVKDPLIILHSNNILKIITIFCNKTEITHFLHSLGTLSSGHQVIKWLKTISMNLTTNIFHLT